MDDQQLPGMPGPWPLTVTRTGDGRAVAVHACPMLLSAFGAGDLEMRDLLICSLTGGSRFQGKTVAAAFGIAPSQVSRIRTSYRQHGARGLVHQMGRPPILSPARLRQARAWAGQGLTHAEIGRKLGVSRSRITELLKKHGTLPAPETLFDDTGEAARTGTAGQPGGGDTDAGPEARGTAGADGEAGAEAGAGAGRDGEGPGWQVARRIQTGTITCRYAGAMLAHAFTDRIGARGLLSAGTGASAAGAGAPADDLGVLVCTQMSFTLGALTLEQAKHLTSADAGALAGLTSLPSLRTWRQRLGELADGCDPLALQRLLASQMLAIEPAESQVYLADDHIAEYTGHQAVALGRNPRRGKPTKGHDDTYICDLAGRAIAFSTGEPSALCSTLPPALAGLTDALPAGDKPGPDTRPLIVFDRGAAFPAVFTQVDAAGYDWLTWRRAPLAPTTLLPVLQTITTRGRRREVAWTDEQVTLKDYAKPVRQLSLFEHGHMVAQAISGRWRVPGGAGRLATGPVGRGEHVQVRHDQLRARHARRLHRRRDREHQAQGQPGLHHRQEGRDEGEHRAGERRGRAGGTARRPDDPGRRQERGADPRRPAEDRRPASRRWTKPRLSARSTPRNCPPARSTHQRPARSCTSGGAACN